VTVTLRTRVIGLAVGTAALVIVLAGIPMAFMLRSDARTSVEQEATYAAQAVADYLSTRSYDDTLLRAYLDRLNRRGPVPVAVRLPDGDILGAVLDTDGAGPAANQPAGQGDHDRDNLGQVSAPRTSRVNGGRLVHVDCQTSHGEAQVIALAADTRVNDRVEARYAAVGLTALALLVLAWLAAEVTGRRIVRPLQRTAETALALSTGELTSRAPTHGPPEVARVAIELNALADRIDELLAREREAAADLSHRLRTPLTAVRLSVESLPPGPGRDELEAHVASLERSLTHVIRTARQGVREGRHPRCDAVEVAADRVGFWAPLAEDQGRAVDIDLPEQPLFVRAGREDLMAAVDALIENVVAHTPEGTAFGLVLQPTADGAELVVLDEGPGIPPGALERGRSDGSTGLGLDIARATAEATGGSLTFTTLGARHGVRMTLRG
jgi:signal transduction histidine kinase